MKHIDYAGGEKSMGFYLNSVLPYKRYKKMSATSYFVDKTNILRDLFDCIEEETQYICITRPRRFGKTIMANMIGAFLGKGWDSTDVFDNLYISDESRYRKYLNHYNVIYIDFSRLPENCTSYQQYIRRISEGLKHDLLAAFPDISTTNKTAVWDLLAIISAKYDTQFVFVMDEWDAVFHLPFITDGEKEEYILFLKSLLKDQEYVALAYITGILPIAKYSSGSELNMFTEFKMTAMEMFGEYFGFTDEEVDALYDKYLHLCKDPQVSREGLREWYDGYFTAFGRRVYNPRSVVMALRFNQLSNYWTSSGPYDEIFYYIRNDIEHIRDDLALMISGEGIDARVEEFAASAMDLRSKNQIYSAMVVYGLLTYTKGKVFIPNRELMFKYEELLRSEKSLGYVYRLANISDQMLKATLSGDTDRMAEILQLAHNTETPILSYNNETELAAVVNLVYLSARDRYRVEREDKAGKGFVDFIFYPENPADTGLILELKAGHSPEEAIRQIREKQYALRFRGKSGEKERYIGQILGVGISYDKDTKEHHCKIEQL